MNLYFSFSTLKKSFATRWLLVCSLTSQLVLAAGPALWTAGLDKVAAEGGKTVSDGSTLTFTVQKSESAQIVWEMPEKLAGSNLYILRAEVIPGKYVVSHPWLGFNLFVRNKDGEKVLSEARRPILEGTDEIRASMYAAVSIKAGKTFVGISASGTKGALTLKRLWLEPYTNVEDAYPFPFSMPDGVVQIRDTEETGKPVNRLLHGYNLNFARTPFGMGDDRFQTAVRALRPGNLRFPTGTQANYYNWKVDGWPEFPDWVKGFVKTSVEALKKNRGGVLGYPEYVKTCLANDVTPILVANLITLEPADLVAWIADMKARGLPVTRVELGNELYDRSQGGELSDPKKYLIRARLFFDAVKKEHPQVRISIPALPEGNGEIDPGEWDRVLAESDFCDAITIHTYNKVRGSFFDKDLCERLLQPEKILDQVLAYYQKSYGRKRPFWLTEWNLMNDTGIDFADFPGVKAAPSVYATQLGALHTALYFLALLGRQDSYELSCFHALGAASSGFGVFDYDYKDPNPTVRLTPTYFVQTFFGELADKSLTHGPLRCDLKSSGPAPLVGRIFYGKDGKKRFLVINRSPGKLKIDLGVAKLSVLKEVSAERLGEAKTCAMNESLVTTSSPGRSPIELSPYSVNLLEE